MSGDGEIDMYDDLNGVSAICGRSKFEFNAYEA
jgi:hypothetical protein